MRGVLCSNKNIQAYQYVRTYIQHVYICTFVYNVLHTYVLCICTYVRTYTRMYIHITHVYAVYMCVTWLYHIGRQCVCTQSNALTCPTVLQCQWPHSTKSAVPSSGGPLLSKHSWEGRVRRKRSVSSEEWTHVHPTHTHTHVRTQEQALH